MNPSASHPETPVGVNAGQPPGAYLPVAEIAAGPRYTRTSLHAAGGMGAVWLARDAAIGRVVAIKELKEGGEDEVARFVREARITGQLEHPGVVPVYEIGQDAQTGRPFYVMRFVRGRTLTQTVRAFHAARLDGRPDPLELVRLLSAFVSVCHTIAYAHSHGVIHRDLKGENVILGEFGEVVVLDWGVAKRVSGGDDRPADPPATAVASRTQVGEVVGTVAYMAPEQAEGLPDQVGPHTDIFGLGALLYEILTGGPPYTGGTFQNLLVKSLLCRFPPPREVWEEVPPGLEAACLKAMAKDPDERFGSAADLGREVQGWQDFQRRQVEEELRQAFERLRCQQAALVALTRSDLFTAADRTAVLRRVVEVAARTLGVERVSVWRLTPDRQTLRCDALYELAADRHSAGAELRASDYPSYFAALAATDVIAADDAQTDARTREFTAGYLIPLGIGAMMEVPIRPNGVLCHEHVGPPRKWLPDEQLFAIAAGQLTAHAVAHWERRQGPGGPGVADPPPGG